MMSFSDASKQRYSETWHSASYLEAEWSDYLLAEQSPTRHEADPLTTKVTPTFYKEMAVLVSKWASTLAQPPTKCCDVGGSTGRTLHEVAHRISSISEFVLAEPAPESARWAKLMLCNPEEIDWIPLVHDYHDCRWDRAKNRPQAIVSTNRSVDIYTCSADEVPRPQSYFDVVTCLNVVDRVASPVALISSLRKLVVPGGLLVVSSPLEFEDHFTPDHANWTVDLNTLFNQQDWISIADTSLIYDFRKYRREWIRYSSQVVAKIKRPNQ